MDDLVNRLHDLIDATERAAHECAGKEQAQVYEARLKDVLSGIESQAARIAALEGERDRFREHALKIAFRLNPHWQGAGLAVDGDWVIGAINLCSRDADVLEEERDEARQLLGVYRVQRDSAEARLTEARDLLRRHLVFRGKPHEEEWVYGGPSYRAAVVLHADSAAWLSRTEGKTL